MTEEITTIRINKSTRSELQAFGRMNENYDDVIRRLLEIAKEVKQ